MTYKKEDEDRRESTNEKGESPTDRLSSLSEVLADPALKSSYRLLIILSLGINRKMNFTDLAELTHIGKGNLNFHVKTLESSGYVETKVRLSIRGPRLDVHITSKGTDLFKQLVFLLSKF